MSDLTDLIKRLEEASEGSRELDGLIFRAINPQAPEEDWYDFGEFGGWHLNDPEDRAAFEPSPFYTTSLDAALTLVPEGHVGRIGFGGPGYVFAFAATPRDWGAGRVSTVRAASPAISLCIAALKARALSKEG